MQFLQFRKCRGVTLGRYHIGVSEARVNRLPSAGDMPRQLQATARA